MKKFLLLMLTFLSFSLCACNQIYEIENNTVVTACFVKNENNKTSYVFYVSAPDGGEKSEETASGSSAYLYEFQAENFSRAIELFNDSGIYKLDISHMMLFAGNKSYFENCFENDEQYLRKAVPSTPLIYSFMYSDDYTELAECISRQYKSDTNKFVKSVFESKTAPYSCTLSELSLARHNKYYTAILPVVGTCVYGESKLPLITGTAVYSSDSGFNTLTDDEHLVYSAWRKNYVNESRAYSLSVNNEILNVNLKDTSIIDTAKKYSIMNIDILNLKHYSRRCFWTYNSYKNFMTGFTLWDTIMTGEKH